MTELDDAHLTLVKQRSDLADELDEAIAALDQAARYVARDVRHPGLDERLAHVVACARRRPVRP